MSDKSRLKWNVEQISFQLAHKTTKSLGWSNRFRQTVPYCRTGNREGSVSKFGFCPWNNVVRLLAEQRRWRTGLLLTGWTDSLRYTGQRLSCTINITDLDNVKVTDREHRQDQLTHIRGKIGKESNSINQDDRSLPTEPCVGPVTYRKNSTIIHTLV